MKCQFCESEQTSMFVTARGPLNLCTHDLEVLTKGYVLGQEAGIQPVTDQELQELFQDVSFEDPGDWNWGWEPGINPDPYPDYGELALDMVEG